jgi:hypothetical protein
MAHGSFEDDAIAGIMNDLFISVKVDREERPDLDVIYQSALSLMGKQGGWHLLPLNSALRPPGLSGSSEAGLGDIQRTTGAHRRKCGYTTKCP